MERHPAASGYPESSSTRSGEIVELEIAGGQVRAIHAGEAPVLLARAGDTENVDPARPLP